MSREEYIVKVEMKRNHPFYFSLSLFMILFMWSFAIGMSIFISFYIPRSENIVFFLFIFVMIGFFLFLPLLFIKDFYPYYIYVYRDRIEIIKRNSMQVQKFIRVIYSLDGARYCYHFEKGLHLVDESKYKCHLVRIPPSDKNIEKKKDKICNALDSIGIKFIDVETHEKWIKEQINKSKEKRAEVSYHQMVSGLGPDYEYGIMKIENIRKRDIP
jgi:hypothetical protein